MTERERSRPWRLLRGAYEIRRALAQEARGPSLREQEILALVEPTLTGLEADPTLGDYGRYRVREFRTLLR